MASPFVWKILLLGAVSLGSLGTARLHFEARVPPVSADSLGTGSSSYGYAYEQRNGLPVSYVHYSSQLEDAYPVHEAVHPAATLPGHAPLAPYYTQYATYHPPPTSHDFHVQPHVSSEEEEEEEEEESGSEQHLENESESAEHARQGYSKQRGFDASEAERLDSGRDRAYYEDEASHAAGHESSAGEHEAHSEKEAAHEGGSHGAESFHRKGERTTGYHKVYRKDEFKKDSEFYDEGHKGGNFERYGSKDARHGAEESSRAEGGTHESGHEKAGKASKGHVDTGRKHVEHRAHEAEEAKDEHSQERIEHASRARQNQARHGLRYRR